MDRRNTGGIGLTDELGENKDFPDLEKPLKNTDKQYIIAKNRNLIQYFAHLGKHTEEESKVDLDLLDKLLKDGARINCTDKYGQTCLHEVRINCTDKYRQTCLHEVRINCTDKYGQTCLHEVRINCTDKYGQTCLHEVRINCTDKYGQTCLHEVRINCTDKYGQTCLHEVRINCR